MRCLAPSWTHAAVLVVVFAIVAVSVRAATAPASGERAHAGRGACSVLVRPGFGLARALDAASPGETICLTAGDFDAGRLVIERSGSRDAPITLRSASPSRRATIHGAILLADSANYWTIEDLRLDGRNRWNMPSPMISGDHSVWRRLDVTNHHAGAGASGGGICFSLGQLSHYGYAGWTTIEQSRIHDCGISDNHNHGIYVTATTGTTVIRDNWIYRNGDRGIQLYPAATRVLIAHNVIDGNGSGVIFSGLGSQTSSDVTVVGNIISNSRNRWNVESWYPSGTPPGRNNVVSHNCLWAANTNEQYDVDGGVAPQIGFVVTPTNVTQRPAFATTRKGVLRLVRSGGCRGFGPRPERQRVT